MENGCNITEIFFFLERNKRFITNTAAKTFKNRFHNVTGRFKIWKCLKFMPNHWVLRCKRLNITSYLVTAIMAFKTSWRVTAYNKGELKWLRKANSWQLITADSMDSWYKLTADNFKADISRHPTQLVLTA